MTTLSLSSNTTNELLLRNLPLLTSLSSLLLPDLATLTITNVPVVTLTLDLPMLVTLQVTDSLATTSMNVTAPSLVHLTLTNLSISSLDLSGYPYISQSTLHLNLPSLARLVMYGNKEITSLDNLNITNITSLSIGLTGITGIQNQKFNFLTSLELKEGNVISFL